MNYSTCFPDHKSGLPEVGIVVSSGEFSPSALDGKATTLVVVGIYESDIGVEVFKALDTRADGAISELVENESFKGKAGSSCTVRLGSNSSKLCVVGLGKKEKDSKAGRSFGEAAAAAVKSSRCLCMQLWSLSGDIDVKQATIGVYGELYEDMRFKEREAPAAPVTSVIINTQNGGQEVAEAAKKVADGICQARRLVNGPANVVDPSFLAAQAEDIAATSDRMTCKILEKEDCEKLCMGSYLGVAAASDLPPKFIHLVYKGAGEIKPENKLALVGKGLTFDAGGYNIKTGPGCMIELMKFDMGGAAVVLGAARAIANLAPDGVEVHFITAACENMISGNPGAMRPGDVLTASNGKTIEVTNTDAEGRLTLADALVYAENQGVAKIVDLATLTGAIIVALGEKTAGVFSPSDDMAEELKQAGKLAGEKQWRMPMDDSEWESMKSPIADMVNAGGRAAGSITAALFLKQFVHTDKVQWAHIDIAGPTWDSKKKGATGYGVATIVEWVLANKNSN